MKNSTAERICTAVIFSLFILSIFAMGKGIAVRSLWLDEATFAENISNFPKGMFSQAAPCPPLLYLLTYILVCFLGKSEWVYRLIPFICGVAGLGILFNMLRRLYTRVPAILSCFLLAMSPKLISYSAQAHPFSVDFFCSALLLFVMTDYLRERYQKSWILWICIASICLPISFPSLFVFSAFAGVIVLHDLSNKDIKTALREIIGVFMPVCIAIALLFFFYLSLTAERTDLAAYSSSFPSSMKPPFLINWLFGSTCAMWGYFFWTPSKGLVGFFLALVGASWLAQKRRVLLMLLCWTPMIIAIFASLLKKWPYGPVRTMIFFLPFAIILLGAGLEAVWQSATTRISRTLIVFACCLLLFSFPSHLKNVFTLPEDSEEAMKTLSQEIKPKIKPEDNLIVYYGADAAFKFYFTEFIEIASIQSWDNRNNPVLQEEFVISAMQKAKSRVWLIFSHVMNDLQNEERWMVSVAARHRELIKLYAAPGCRAYLLQ
jgi:hypothetical protein